MASNLDFLDGLIDQPVSDPSVDYLDGLLGPQQPAPQEIETPEQPSMIFGEFGRGVRVGLRQVGTDFAALGAVGANIFDANETEQELIDLVRERGEESHKRFPKTVAKIEDIDSVSDFVRFTARALGEQVPVIASIVAGGGAGGLAGRLVARGAASRIAAQQAVSRLPRVGAGVGAVATASGLETGVTAEEQIGSVGEIDPGVALTAGIFKGSLEAIVPAALGARLGLTPDLSRGLLGAVTNTFNRVLPRRLASVPAVGMTEGLTEALQESVDIGARAFVDENYDVLSEETKSRLINAAGTGALVGMFFGPLFGGGGALEGSPETQSADAVEQAQIAAQQPAGLLPPPAVEIPQGPAGLPAPPGIVPPGGGLPAPEVPLQITDQRFPSGPITPTEGVIRTEQGVLGLGQGQINVPPTEGQVTQIPPAPNAEFAALERELLPDPNHKLTIEIPEPSSVSKAEQQRQRPAPITQAEIPSAEIPARSSRDLEGRVIPVSEELFLETLRSGDARTAASMAVQLGDQLQESGLDVAIPADAKRSEKRLLETIAGGNRRHFVPFAVNVARKRARERAAFENAFPTRESRELQQLGIDTVGDTFTTEYGSITDQQFREIFDDVDFGPTTSQRYNELRQTVDPLQAPESVARNYVRGFVEGTNTPTEQVEAVTDEIISLTRRNKVQWIGAAVTPQISERANTVADAYKQLKSQLNIESDILVLTDMSTNTDAGKFRSSENFDIIELDLNSPKWRQTAIHEFGHLLVTRKFYSAPQEMKEALITAYNERLVRTELVEGLEGFGLNFAGPTRGLDVAQIDPTGAQIKAAADYWLGFDEFMAEQLVRAAASNNPATSGTGKFFADLATQLKSAMKRLLEFFAKRTGKDEAWVRERARNFRPEREYEDFLDYVRAAPRDSYSQDYAQSQAESVARNERRLDENEWLGHADREAGAESAATASVKNFLKKLKVGQKEIDGVTAPADKYNWFIKLFWSIQQIADKNRGIAPLQRYVELVDQWYIFTMSWVSKANDTLRQWISLGQKQGAALSALIYDVETMSYRKQGEFLDRLPTEQELAELAQKHGVNAAGLEVYQRIQSDFADVFNQIEETTIRDIRRTVLNERRQIQEVTKVREEFDAARQRPYFPHSRFGDFAVVVRDREGKILYMEQFGTRTAARKAVGKIRRDNPGGITTIRKVPKSVQVFRGLPATMLETIRNRLDLTEEQQGWLDDFLAELAQSSGLKKSFARRKDTPGFSLDAMRTYANYFFHGARHFARIEYGPLMEQEIANLTAQNGTVADGIDISKRDALRDYMAQHYDYIMNPTNDWAQLRSLAFMWWIGFVVQSAALNMTQIPLVGYPWLASQFGDTKSVLELNKAALKLRQLYQNKPGALPENFAKALDRAVREGVVDESQATELAGVAQGQYISRLMPGTKVQRMLMNFNHYGSWMFATSEKMNRRIMFRAAWELAQKTKNQKYLDELVEQNSLLYEDLINDGYSPQDAKAYLSGRDAVERTQFRYAAHTRPEFMRGKKGVLFTFFMFVQNMVWFAAHSPGNTRFLVMMLAMGGLMGLPGAEDMSAAAKFASKKLLGKDFDVEEEIRELVTEMLGSDVPPDLLLFGSSRYGFGLPAAMDALGLPKAHFDISANISMGRIVPGLAEILSGEGDFDSKYNRVTTDIAGASFGIGLNLLKALSDDQLPADDFKRWERAMPRALKNINRAARYLAEGRERSRTGATVLEYDLSDPDHMAEIFGQALGFTPARSTQMYSFLNAKRETEMYWGTQRRILLTRFDQSYVLNDPAMRKDVMQDIRAFNKRVPFPSIAVTGRDIAKSRKLRIQGRRKEELGLAKTRRFAPLVEQVESLYPEVTAADGEVTNVEDAGRIARGG